MNYVSNVYVLMTLKFVIPLKSAQMFLLDIISFKIHFITLY